jgi:PKHD-type hydroxylase
MSNYTFAPMPPIQGENSVFATWENGFSKEELDRLAEYCDQNLLLNGATIDRNNRTGTEPDWRKSNTGWIANNENTAWFYDKMAFIARKINSIFYRFDLYGFVEDMQYTVYRGDGDHYDWHIDAGDTTIVPRKLSFSLQLSDPQEYEGGNLEFMIGRDIDVAGRERGLVVAFPSYRLHRVTPVTKGVRKSIVVWTAGPHFR